MDEKFLAILVCPRCRGTLHYDRAAQELICTQDQLAYPIQDGIPVMLPEKARDLHSSSPDAQTNS